MTKKKSTPTSLILNVPQGTEGSAIVPPYEDPSVRFQNYSKVPTGGGYVLKRQEQSSLFVDINAGSGHQNLERPSFPIKNFVMTYLTLSFSNPAATPSYFALYDAVDIATNGRLLFYLTRISNAGADYLVFDFSGSPRKFVNQYIDFYNSSVGDVSWGLYGFLEDK